MDYLSHFQLTAEPFSNAPLPRFYYGSRQHTDALERLRYAASTMKGLAILIGDIGLGKTTLARRMLEALPESEYEAAMLVIVHAGITPNWLLKRIAIQLAVPDPADDKLTILSQLYQRLVQIHDSGKKAVVLIDEAQMLATRELMEEFRGLLNLEVPENKLISFIFFGLPEIEQNLRLDPPLAQRIALRYHLKPLGVEDTHAYVKHRLALSGAQDRELFTWAALDEIFRFTRGVPRLINTLCDNVLLEMFFSRTPQAEPAIVQMVATNLGLTAANVVEPVAPEIPVPNDEPAVAGGPGADAIVAVDRQDEQTPMLAEAGSFEPDSIAAQVASEPLQEEGATLQEYGDQAATPSAEASIALEPITQPEATPELAAPVLEGEVAAPGLEPILEPIAEAPVLAPAVEPTSVEPLTEQAGLDLLSQEVPAPAPVAVEDRGPPAVPLTRVERTTVDIEDPLAFLSTVEVPEPAPEPETPSPWEGSPEGAPGAEAGDVPELAATDLEVVEQGEAEELAGVQIPLAAGEVEVDVTVDEPMFADKTPPRPAPVPIKESPPTPVQAAKPEPVRPAPRPTPAPVAKPAAKPASKGMDLSDIDAFLADLNLPPKKK